ncbi:unnamed protein product [Dovyalis caffra]|uniref:Uncharacterized protein n=1 Tax=Dovyalis caffra TaxID=77055 RepID=A0AAV1QZ84_9ROSI|nr:unnamed protein product [Dovyalis caffra]
MAQTYAANPLTSREGKKFVCTPVRIPLANEKKSTIRIEMESKCNTRGFEKMKESSVGESSLIIVAIQSECTVSKAALVCKMKAPNAQSSGVSPT